LQELPRAERQMGNPQNEWSRLRDLEGETPSERRLVALGRAAMLSLWSYPNVYTDEGRRERGDGKELCDLLIVFGDDVLLFSDKHCQFPEHTDVNVAWRRWYRRAIGKSVRQLAGAQSWLERFPNRIFLDSKCQHPLPVSLPPIQSRRVHLIAVARGSALHATKHWDAWKKGSSASLVLDTQLIGAAHETKPFNVGWPLGRERFVHVLDDTSLELLMNELDTAPDFIDYLRKKESLLSDVKTDFLVLGEEELLARYLVLPEGDTGKQDFPKFEEGSLVVIPEGAWQSLRRSLEYKARSEANEISYLWDELIEYQASHVIAGSSEIMPGERPPDATQELTLRVMASENRVARRALGAALRVVRSVDIPNARFTRTVVSGKDKTRAYVLMSLPRAPDQQYGEGGFNRSLQHWVVDWILDIHLRLRLVSSSRVFFGALCSAHWRRRGSPGRSIGTGRYPWGSIAVEGHSCFRSCRAAMGCGGRRRRLSPRTQS